MQDWIAFVMVRGLFMKEIWRKIPFDTRYEVSNFGNMRHVGYSTTDSRGRTKYFKPTDLTLQKDKDGYCQINLRVNCKPKTYKVHRFVAMCFLSNYSEGLQVNHKNGIKDDNKVRNLEMVTCSENLFHKFRVLKYKDPNSPSRAKEIFGDKVRQIDPNTNEVVNTFLSAADACKHIGRSHTAIGIAIRRGNKSGGFKWEYITRHNYRLNKLTLNKQINYGINGNDSCKTDV